MIRNVQKTKHVLNIAIETHVSYPIFVVKMPFVKFLLTDLFVDVLKDGVVYQQLNISNAQCSMQTPASAVAALNSSLNSYASQATQAQAAAQMLQQTAVQVASPTLDIQLCFFCDQVCTTFKFDKCLFWIFAYATFAMWPLMNHVKNVHQNFKETSCEHCGSSSGRCLD